MFKSDVQQDHVPYETNTRNVNRGIVTNKERRATYGGRRSSAQVGLLAKAFRDGDQLVTGTLKYLDSMWSDYKGGCIYRQHI